jgi:hypothetical protein
MQLLWHDYVRASVRTAPVSWDLASPLYLSSPLLENFRGLVAVLTGAAAAPLHSPLAFPKKPSEQLLLATRAQS